MTEPLVRFEAHELDAMPPDLTVWACTEGILVRPGCTLSDEARAFYTCRWHQQQAAGGRVRWGLRYAAARLAASWRGDERQNRYDIEARAASLVVRSACARSPEPDFT